MVEAFLAQSSRLDVAVVVEDGKSFAVLEHAVQLVRQRRRRHDIKRIDFRARCLRGTPSLGVTGTGGLGRITVPHDAFAVSVRRSGRGQSMPSVSIRPDAQAVRVGRYPLALGHRAVTWVHRPLSGYGPCLRCPRWAGGRSVHSPGPFALPKSACRRLGDISLDSAPRRAARRWQLLANYRPQTLWRPHPLLPVRTRADRRWPACHRPWLRSWRVQTARRQSMGNNRAVGVSQEVILVFAAHLADEFHEGMRLPKQRLDLSLKILLVRPVYLGGDFEPPARTAGDFDSLIDRASPGKCARERRGTLPGCGRNVCSPSGKPW